MPSNLAIQEIRDWRCQLLDGLQRGGREAYDWIGWPTAGQIRMISIAPSCEICWQLGASLLTARSRAGCFLQIPTSLSFLVFAVDPSLLKAMCLLFLFYIERCLPCPCIESFFSLEVKFTPSGGTHSRERQRKGERVTLRHLGRENEISGHVVDF